MKKIEINVILIVCLVVACLCLPVFADAPRDFIGDSGTGWDTRNSVVGVVDWGASSDLSGRQVVNTVSGGGISADGLTHNTGVFDYPPRFGPPVGDAGMWLSANAVDGGGVIPGYGTHFIVYIFDKAYSLADMWIWNYNENNWTIAGMKSVKIVADTGTGWASGTTLFTGIIPQATGTATNPVNLIVDGGGISAKGVGIFSVYGSEHNWSSGSTNHGGLSEVRFYPVYAPRHFIGDTGTGWDTNSVVAAGASSGVYERLPINTINGSGIGIDGLTHNTTVFGGMWLSGGGVDANHPYGVNASTHWIKYFFGTTHSIDEMWIWNYNESAYLTMGMKQVRILASVTDDEAGWIAANANPVFEGIIPQADGTNSNFTDLKVNFAGRQARYIVIASAVGNEHNWSNGTYENDGLGEVRFYLTPADCDEAKAWGLGLEGDLTDDCRVTFADFADFAKDWLNCVNPQDANCL